MTGPIDASFEIHNNDDVDSRPEAHHHTTGLAPYQHSSGAHTHDGINSPALSPPAIQQAVPVGTIIMWLGAPSTIPAGWVILDGHVENSSSYPLLAAHLGVVGSTFTTPNFQGRVPLGVDGGIYRPEGSTGGATTVAGADHNHGLNNGTAYAQIAMAAGSPSLAGNFLNVTSYTPTLGSSTPVVAASGVAQGRGAAVRGTTDNSGALPATSVVQPYIALRFLIRAV